MIILVTFDPCDPWLDGQAQDDVFQCLCMSKATRFIYFIRTKKQNSIVSMLSTYKEG